VVDGTRQPPQTSRVSGSAPPSPSPLQALDLGAGMGAGAFPYQGPGGWLAYYGERLLLRLLGPRAFPSLSIVEEVKRWKGLPDDAAFLDRYEASRIGVEELWRSRSRERPEETEAFYDEHDADLWRQAYRSRWSRSYRARMLLVARVVRQLTRGDRRARLLDFGCGAGVLAHRLTRDGYRELSLADLPSPTLRFCEASLGDRVRACIEVGTGRELPGIYDIILCLDALEHTVEPLPIARQLVGALAPGGALVVSYPLAQDFSFTHTRQAAEDRPAVMEFFQSSLEVLLPERIYRKPLTSPCSASST
jgi:2-polyprenyl-3-methyl-5-hydroxy-6-metoxy-1,4-benzoquinol methylase